MWISPIVENIKGGTPDGYTEDGSAYHGYWAQDIYAINSHFGTPEDLKALATALHSRGMVETLRCRNDWSRANPEIST